MWLGITEYLFTQPGLLDECIDTALHDDTFRSDDLEFTFAARVSCRSHSLTMGLIRSKMWSERVAFADFEGYRKRFEDIQTYFEPRFEDARIVGNEMLRKLSTLSPSNER